MKLNGNIRLFNISIGLSSCQKIYNHLFLNIHNIPLKHSFPYWDFEAMGMVEEFQEGHGDWSCSISNSCLVAMENCRLEEGGAGLSHSEFPGQVSPWDLGPFSGSGLPLSRMLGSTYLLSESPALAWASREHGIEDLGTCVWISFGSCSPDDFGKFLPLSEP